MELCLQAQCKEINLFLIFASCFYFDLMIIFLSWCSGEPNNWGGSDTAIGEGCGQLKRTCFNDRTCTDKLWFVCRRSPLTKPITKPDPAATTCPSGWILNKQSCYLKVDKGYDWDSADAYCKTQVPTSYLADTTDYDFLITINWFDMWVKIILL